MTQRYYILQFTDDGPSRAQGNKCHGYFGSAQKDVEKLCKEHPKSKFGIFELQGSFWLNPNPEVFNDMPKEAKADA